MVKVNTNSNTIKVNAASAGRASNLSIGTPQSYYDGLAKEWAISDNLVQGIDYSSKYYANIAKSNADSSKANLDSVRDAAEEVIAAKDNALNDISDAKINTLESLIDEGNNQIELIKEQGSSYATKEDAKYTAGNGIDITDNIISNTQTSAEWGNITGNIENQEDLVNYVKKYSGGLEVCDIGMSLYIDETKGLRRWLNGQIVAINQNTQGFLTRLKKIVALYPSLLTTEENWQAAKTLSDYGQVGKFVFNYAQELIEEDAFIALAENDEGYDWALKKSDAGFDTITSDNYTTLIGKKVYQVILTDGKRKANGVTSTITNLTPKSVSSTSWNATIEANVTTFTLYSNTFKTWLFEQSETVESVRLPAVVNVQGLLDLQNLGMTVEAGLPNIEGMVYYRHGYLANATGAFYRGNAGTLQRVASGDAGTDYNLLFDASRSNPIYGATDTVQEEAIQYPYYIQIATGQETEVNIRNDIESIVPYTLFDSKYSEAKQYNASWVLGGSTLSKSVYPPAYEAALVEYNSEIADGTTVELPSGGSYTKRGVSGGITVKLSTDETVTEYDWKLDTVAETLTVPTLNGSEDLLSDRYDDLELNASGSTYTAPANGWFWIQKLASSTGQYLTPVIKDSNGNIKYTLTSQPTAAGYDAEILAPVSKGDVISIGYSVGGATKSFRFIYAKSNGSLYFFVASVAQNAPLANLGRIEETKVDKNSSWGFPSNRYIDLELGASGSTYTAPAKGYFAIHCQNKSATDWTVIFQVNKLYGNACGRYFQGASALTMVPCLKNDTISLYYDGTLNTSSPYWFRFIYAEGSN